MEVLTNITNVKELPGSTFLECICSVENGESFENGVTYVYSPEDIYAGAFGKSVGKWLSDNQGSYTIEPFIEPVLTPDEIRANMPALTSRQFWMAAANIDIDKDVLVSTIKAAMPDSIDRKMMIAELEASKFERMNPTVIDLMALLEIPAEQVDALWTWASGL